MKRFAFSLILFTVLCSVTSRAQDAWDNYVQQSLIKKKHAAPLPNGSALDDVVNSRSKPAPAKDSGRPKENVYRPPVQKWKANSVKDDREVIVTKDAIVKQNLVVKTVPPDKLTVKPNKAKSPISNVQRSPRLTDHTLFSPVQHAPQ